MKKIDMKRIEIIQDETANGLIQQINAMMEQGWEVSGDLIVTPIKDDVVYTQRMSHDFWIEEDYAGLE